MNNKTVQMKQKLLIICLLAWQATISFAQDNSKGEKVARSGDSIQIADYVVDEPFIIVEQMPQFKGGEKKMIEYIKQNSHFPVVAKGNVKTMVIVDFIVEKNGSISNIHLLRGVGADYDKEAIRIVSEMPSWEVGKQGENPVRVKITLPIHFK